MNIYRSINHAEERDVSYKVLNLRFKSVYQYLGPLSIPRSIYFGFPSVRSATETDVKTGHREETGEPSTRSLGALVFHNLICLLSLFGDLHGIALWQLYHDRLLFPLLQFGTSREEVTVKSASKK
jgi:hypothetical protein